MAEPSRFSKETFREWRHNRLTPAFLQYLKDQRDLLMEQWGRGQEMSPQQQCKALLFQELSTLNWADVRDFYKAAEEWRDELAAADAEASDEE